jgi:P27 family predicted phage terminase small subunit
MGKPGPKPMPANVHLLRGNPSKKPLASLLDEVVRPDVAIPKCPIRSEAFRKEWKRITPHLERLGLVSELDRAMLVGYCTAWADLEWAEHRMAEYNKDDATGERGRVWDTPSGYKQISVLMQIRNRALEQLKSFSAEFGLSPASRSRVTASDPQLSLPGVEEKPSETGWGAFPNG